MPRQRHYYGLNHLHFITASTYRRARLFDSDEAWLRRLTSGRGQASGSIAWGMIPPFPWTAVRDRTHRQERDVCATRDIAERARKIGGATLRSIVDIARHQRLKDSDEELVTPKDMLAELCADNQQLTRFLRSTHEACERYNDVATASMIENWIDQAERRAWFLSQIMRGL